MKATAIHVATLCIAVACRATNVPKGEPHLETKPPGDAIVVCGERVPIGAPVVLWNEFPGYDAYRTAASGVGDKAVSGLRYQPGRMRKEADGSKTVLVEPDCRDVERLAEVVDQFVLHYDVCGTSRTCFRVLHEQRGLSVHFLLDIDGTIYQTLDVREQAFHATKANTRSVGIEIANIGAYPVKDAALGKRSPLDEWYAEDAAGPYISVPERLEGGGVRIPGFIGRPARSECIEGTIQGERLEQFDFTREQYESLAKLTAGLCRVLPNIAPDAPRDESGNVKDRVLGDEEFDAFRGIVGHYHVQANKSDPGPAFDWAAFLMGVRARIASP